MNFTRRRGVRNPRNSRSHSQRPRDGVPHRHHHERQTCHTCFRVKGAISRADCLRIHRCVHRSSDAVHSALIGFAAKTNAIRRITIVTCAGKFATVTSLGWTGQLAFVVGVFGAHVTYSKLGGLYVTNKGSAISGRALDTALPALLKRIAQSSYHRVFNNY